MSTFAPLTSLPSGLQLPAGGWDRGRPSADGGARGTGDAASAFGFNGSTQAARTLSVPPASGQNVAQMEARFLDCLFERGAPR